VLGISHDRDRERLQGACIVPQLVLLGAIHDAGHLKIEISKSTIWKRGDTKVKTSYVGVAEARS